jgi:hypothetical protein
VLNLQRPTSNSSSTTNFPWLYPTENWLTGSADFLQDNTSARAPRKTPPSFVKYACVQLRCLAIDVLLFRAFAWHGPHRKQFSLYCHILNGGVTGLRIGTAVLLLLPVFVAVRMFTHIPLLLRNLATDSLSRSRELVYKAVAWQCVDMPHYSLVGRSAHHKASSCNIPEC